MEHKEQVNQVSDEKDQASHKLSWHDLPLARAADLSVTGADLIDHLRMTLQQNVILDLIQFKIMEKELDRLGIEVTEDEVDEALTQFRLARHLLTSKATEKWLKDQRLSNQDLSDIAERQVKIRKLKLALFDDDAVSERFALTKTSLTQVSCYQIVVSKEQKAAELAALIRLGNSFFDLARQHSEDESTRLACGYAGVKRVGECDPEIQSVLTAVSSGDIIGPVKCAGQFYLLFIEHIYPAALDQETRETIRTDLFRNWGRQQIETVAVEILV